MRIHLKREFFAEKEFVFLQNGQFKVTFFKYSTGVEAIRVENSKGYFIILPFQGQQIWRAGFLGKELVMKTKFEEPMPTLEYLMTYGGFLLHCGIQAFGVPSKEDTHVKHGELPNAPYRNAYIECTEEYVAVGGCLDYDISFVCNYSFRPECKLYQDDTVLKIHVQLENRRHTPMEYMYLCHINFRPMDGSRLIYSAEYDEEHIKVHKNIPEDMPKDEAAQLLDYINRVRENLPLHHEIGGPNQFYNPEVTFTVLYQGDENNRAYTLQAGREGACYVSHPVDVLPYGIRWIARTGDEDSCGMVLPATAEHFGYNYAKKHRQIKILGAMEILDFDIEAGYLDRERSQNLIREKKLI